MTTEEKNELAAAITWLSCIFCRPAEEVAKVERVYSDVVKTTEMTCEQVLDLNESLKQMGTRASREEFEKYK